MRVPAAIVAIMFTVIVGFQCWIAKEIVDLKVQVAIHLATSHR